MLRRSLFVAICGVALFMVRPLCGGICAPREVSGCVVLDDACDGVFDHPGPDVALEGVKVTLNLEGGGSQTVETSGPDGAYEFLDVPCGMHTVTLEVPDGLVFNTAECSNALAGTCLEPHDVLPLNIKIVPEAGLRDKLNFLLCRGGCWMTGGGVKFEVASASWNAELVVNRRGKKGANGNGPSDTVGGVVFPSCSQSPSNGGNWNHLFHSLNLHLKGKDVFVVRCGNVDGIEPGTESPVCDVNFIEFQGEGTLEGVGPNQLAPMPVKFCGRVEDHNEPGNENAAQDPLDIDRYTLDVKDPNDGDIILSIAYLITGGNFQIHCSSCDDGDGGGGGGEALRERYAEGLRRGTFFLRGDVNTDGGVDISDAVFGLNHLFSRSPAAPRCMDAADANDDGVFDMADAVTLLGGLFASGPISAPFPAAGIDRTVDRLDCGLLLR